MELRCCGRGELFALSDVVSVRAPQPAATRGLVSAELPASMRQGSVLINTSRYAVVGQEALTRVLKEGRVHAVPGVTGPEVLPPRRPLWDCDNALITPRPAGSQGDEWRRPADPAAGGVARWAAGGSFAHPVPYERLEFLA